MKFEYRDYTFTGTRDEIIRELRNYLGNRTVCYTGAYKTWYLCSEVLADDDDYTAREAKSRMVEQIVNSVPKDEFWFNDTSFESLEALKQHLWALPLKYEKGWFILGGRRQIFASINVISIKDTMIREILCSAK